MRETRDLLRRRTFLVRRRAELLAHRVNTNSQYNLPPLTQKLCYAANRAELDLAARFTAPSVKQTVAIDRSLSDPYDARLDDVERYRARSGQPSRRLTLRRGLVPPRAEPLEGTSPVQQTRKRQQRSAS